MATLNITKRTPIQRTPRLMQVEGSFDLQPAQTSEFHIAADLPLDKKPWQIGIITGPSGSGKSTVARELFGGQLVEGFDWPKRKSIVDAFPKQMPIKEICGLLSSVGFSSPPAWLRPFHVLSNGEQFRVTLARALAENSELCVIDEFTSVVDRTVARIGSAAVAKHIRKLATRFVAVSCHYDIIDWLQPDWIFDAGSATFKWRRLRPRPKIDIEIVRTDSKTWRLFQRHHYLSHSLAASAKSFVALVEGRPAVFTAVLSFPHAKRPGWREHRTVCLPDFQGVGLGNAMSDFIAGMFAATGKPYRSITSHPAMIGSRLRSKNWKCTRRPSMIDRVSTGIKTVFSKPRPNAKAHFLKSASINRVTASFEFVGPKQTEAAKGFGLIL